MAKKRYTPEQKQKAKEMWKSGHTHAKISEEVGTHASTIGYWKNQWRVEEVRKKENKAPLFTKKATYEQVPVPPPQKPAAAKTDKKAVVIIADADTLQSILKETLG